MLKSRFKLWFWIINRSFNALEIFGKWNPYVIPMFFTVAACNTFNNIKHQIFDVKFFNNNVQLSWVPSGKSSLRIIFLWIPLHFFMSPWSIVYIIAVIIEKKKSRTKSEWEAMDSGDRKDVEKSIGASPGRESERIACEPMAESLRHDSPPIMIMIKNSL